ncbi:MAG: c-type cytochrome [Nannocystaceae bacterium]
MIIALGAAGCGDSSADPTGGSASASGETTSADTDAMTTAASTDASTDATATATTAASTDATTDATMGATTSATTATSTTQGTSSSTDATTDATTTDGTTGVADPEYVVVYQDLCAPCHGVDGEGVAPAGPEIRHVHPLMAAYMVRNGDANTTLNKNNMLVGHPGTMPAFTTEDVSDAVLDEIVAWLQTFPQEVGGQALFADHCSFCHGLQGGTDVEYASAYHNMPFLTSGASDTLPKFIAKVRSGHVVDDMMQPVPPSKRRAYMPPFGPEIVTDAQLTEMEAWARQQ